MLQGLGIATIVVGVLARLKLLEALADEVINDEEFETVIKILPTLIIVMGCVVFIIAFTGCCGSVTETKCLLITVRKLLGTYPCPIVLLTTIIFHHVFRFM